MKQTTLKASRSRAAEIASSVLIVKYEESSCPDDRIPFDGTPEVLFSGAENIPPKVIIRNNPHTAGKTKIVLSGKLATAIWLYFRKSILCAIVKADLPAGFANKELCRTIHPVVVYRDRDHTPSKMSNGAMMESSWETRVTADFNPALRGTPEFYEPLRDEVSHEEENKIRASCTREWSQYTGAVTQPAQCAATVAPRGKAGPGRKRVYSQSELKRAAEGRINGLPVSEIARQMDRPPSYVRRLLDAYRKQQNRRQ